MIHILMIPTSYSVNLNSVFDWHVRLLSAKGDHEVPQCLDDYRGMNDGRTGCSMRTELPRAQLLLQTPSSYKEKEQNDFKLDYVYRQYSHRSCLVRVRHDPQ